MILGIGLDLVELSRIREGVERFGKRFTEKVLTPAELEQLPERDPIPRIAALFAAKEAAVKALGTGFAEGVTFLGVEVLHGPTGKPDIFFRDEALRQFENAGGRSAHISLTHSKDNAAAVVVLES